jgi:predicted metal-dependent hydrolase
MWTEPRYVEGLRLFSEGHWFEAHEVLELLWKEQPPGPDRLFLQGLIQLAVSLEHWRRGSPRSAWGQWEKARMKLEPLPSPYGGLNLAQLLRDFEAYYVAVELESWLEAELPPVRRLDLQAPVPTCVEAGSGAAGGDTPRGDAANP